MSRRIAVCIATPLSLLVYVALGGCSDDAEQRTSDSTTTTVVPAEVIEETDVSVVTEKVEFSDGTSLLPSGDLPTDLPYLQEISREANRRLSENPDAVGPDVYFGRLERGSSNTLGDGTVVIAVRLYGVLVVPNCPRGADCAGPVPSIDTTFYDAATGERVLQEQIGCDQGICASPDRVR